jgi:hypothetical protein
MEIIWQSQIESDDVLDLSEEEQQELADQLDDVVMAICQDWGLYQ